MVCAAVSRGARCRGLALLANVVQTARHERRPSGLVARSAPTSRIGVEILVEQHEITPAWLLVQGLRHETACKKAPHRVGMAWATVGVVLEEQSRQP